MEKERVDSGYLASTHVNTPDPRQKNPPKGDKLIVEWYVPQDLMKKNPRIDIDIAYWDYTTAKLSFPINRNLGNKVLDVLGEKYQKNKGLLSYKAQIVEENGTVFRTWTHQLWVKLIESQEEPALSKDELFNEPTYVEDPFDSSW